MLRDQVGGQKAKDRDKPDERRRILEGFRDHGFGEHGQYGTSGE